MYPLYWTTSKGGIFMRYSYEFKRKCVELYREGKYPETPNGISTERFKIKIREWVRLVENNGFEVLQHKPQNKNWTPEERYELVSQVLVGNSYSSVAISAGINSGTLYQWVHKYKTLGYNGLVNKKRGRNFKEASMKKKSKPLPLNESEREELIRLRAEIEYLETEIEVIKKEMALRHEKWAAQLKAKKQRLSKNSEKKDTN